MRTAIVVDNYDPICNGRCKVRVIGIHTETIDGKYLILDDDLPWALPNNQSNSFSIPKVGDKVYVDVVDPYTIFYYGKTECDNRVKLLQSKFSDSLDRLIVFGSSDEVFGGERIYLEMYYHPDNGLTIDCNGDMIKLPKDENIEILSKNGAGITINRRNNDISIHTDGKVNLSAKQVCIDDGDESVILGSKLMEKFNSHTHFTSGGISNPPIEKIVPSDFSDKIKIS